MAETDFKVRLTRDGVQVLAKQLDDLGPLLEIMGRYLVAAGQVAFLNQSFDGQKWPTRSGSARKPSVMGVVQDLAAGPEVAASRFTSTPAIVNTGALRRSLRAHVAGPKTLVMSSALPYARLMNDGGPSSLAVSDTVKANLADLLRSRKDLRPALGFLFRRDEVHTEVPPRQFLGAAESSRERLTEIARGYLQERAGQAPRTG